MTSLIKFGVFIVLLTNGAIGRFLPEKIFRSLSHRSRDGEPQDDCNCDWRVYKHYEAKGCLMVQTDSCGCPTSYSCTSVKQSDTQEKVCTYHGEAYKVGERIRVADSCQSCRCVDGITPHVVCRHRECPQLDPVEGENCHLVYEENKCCPSRYECLGDVSKNAIEASAVICAFNNVTYPLGAKIYPPDDPCLVCECREDWNGMDNTSCHQQECVFERKKHLLDAGCIPVYHERKCCPIEYYCPDNLHSRTMELRELSPENSTENGGSCIFDGNSYELGAELSLNKSCVKCNCQVPPDFTCIHQSCPRPSSAGKCVEKRVEGQCCPTYDCLQGDSAVTEITPTDEGDSKLSTADEGDSKLSTAVEGDSEVSTLKEDDNRLSTMEEGNDELSTAEDDSKLSTAVGESELFTAEEGDVELSTSKEDDNKLSATGVSNDEISTAEDELSTAVGDDEISTAEDELSTAVGNSELSTAEESDGELSTIEDGNSELSTKEGGSEVFNTEESDNELPTTEGVCPTPLCADDSCRIEIPPGHECPTCVCGESREKNDFEPLEQYYAEGNNETRSTEDDNQTMSSSDDSENELLSNIFVENFSQQSSNFEKLNEIEPIMRNSETELQTEESTFPENEEYFIQFQSNNTEDVESHLAPNEMRQKRSENLQTVEMQTQQSQQQWDVLQDEDEMETGESVGREREFSEESEEGFDELKAFKSKEFNKPSGATIELEDTDFNTVVWTSEIPGCPTPLCADSSCRIGVPPGHRCPTCICKKAKQP